MPVGAKPKVKTKATAKKATAKKATAKKATAKKATAKKATATRNVTPSDAPPKQPRIFTMSFASVYPLYVQKAERKGRTKQEVDEIIAWLTGYSSAQLQRVIDDRIDFETFFERAPRINPNVRLITCVVCGVRVEDVAEPLMKKIRYLDKLIDELAKGKALAAILRR